MNDPRTFISFDFDYNETEKMLFVGQSKNSKTPFNIEDWSSKSALPQSQWKTLVEEKINKCNLLIVLVGKNTARATGVAAEIEMATRNNVPFFGIYVGGANSLTSLPSGLARNRTIDWSWDKIASAISQVMNEGKNSSTYGRW